MCTRGFIEILVPLAIIFSAIAIGLGYKMINKKATMNDPIEQEVIKVIEDEAEDIIKAS